MNQAAGKNINSLYSRIKEILDKARNNVYRTANIEMVIAYWNIGKEIIEEEQNGKERAKYGKYLIKELSEKLSKDFGRGFDESNLRNIRKFYKIFPIRDALRHELSWTHYRLLMRVVKNTTRDFYIREAIAGKWSTRELERQINSMYFERLLMSKDKKVLIQQTENENPIMQPDQIIKDPFVLEFLKIKHDGKLSENELETALINKLQQFLLELGKGFSLVGRQYRITTETGKHFYVDLVFYNYILNCFLLIDLKTRNLTHQDIGQIDFYVRYFEDNCKKGSDNPTIGLILCTGKDKTIVKYSLLKDSEQIFASKYQMYLPTVKQLAYEIQEKKEQIEQEKRIRSNI